MRNKWLTPTSGRPQSIWYLLFIGPWLVGLLFFYLGPLLANLLLSLFNYDTITLPTFAGLSNYLQLRRDPIFWASLGRSTLYVATVVPLSLALAWGISRLLPEKSRGSWARFLRLGWALPGLLGSGVTGALLLGQIFPQRPLSPILYWGLGLWGVGGTALLLHTGLARIPNVRLHAALLEGASPWQLLRLVIWPALLPAAGYVLATGTIFAYQIFTPVYLLTEGEGSPGQQALFHPLYLYMSAFRQQRFGYAAAQSLLLAVGCLGLTLMALFFLRHLGWDDNPEQENEW